jgi:hypothetical protein
MTGTCHQLGASMWAMLQGTSICISFATAGHLVLLHHLSFKIFISGKQRFHFVYIFSPILGKQ